MVVLDVMNIGDVERVYAAAQTPQDQFLLTVIETLPMRLISLESLQWKDIIPGRVWFSKVSMGKERSVYMPSSREVC